MERRDTFADLYHTATLAGITRGIPDNPSVAAVSGNGDFPNPTDALFTEKRNAAQAGFSNLIIALTRTVLLGETDARYTETTG